MTSSQTREKFLNFFKKKKHTIVPSSSLIPADSSVLFTTAGMQQFKPYLSGEVKPPYKRAASCQKCFRTNDIDEVGDNTHHTFFEMLGNWSFGDYFEEEAIDFALEFLIKECNLPKEKLWVTIFKGENNIPRDEETFKIWQEKGIPKERIFEFDIKENFWGPVAETGPCGPCSEIHYEKWTEPCVKQKNCGPNCECERFVEIWNLVFMTYNKNEKGEYELLPQKNIDTGIGFERLVAVVQKKESNYETDLFWPIIEEISRISAKPYNSNQRFFRIIADHIKGTVFLASEGIEPSNLERGYILRRLIRRAIRYGRLMDLQKNFLIPLAEKVVEIYKDIYPELKSKETDILTIIRNEEEKFGKTLESGLKELNKFFSEWRIKSSADYDYGEGYPISDGQKLATELGQKLFFIYQSYGLPLELSLEELEKISGTERFIYKEQTIIAFQEELKKHQELSRTASAGMFKGGLVDTGEQAVEYHTATHLLLAALRQVLGDHIFQKGSNINTERLRFDFSHPQKMTEEEIKKVEDLVNQKIKENLPVICEEMSLAAAKEKNIVGVFENKYGERVKVYTIGEFSKEICGGPHVKRTGELGNFKITKEEASAAGVRRIKAVLE